MGETAETTEVTTEATESTATETVPNTLFETTETTEATETSPDGEESTEQKTEGAPEAYEDFTLPEETTILPEVLDKFKTLAKDFNLTQDKAQELLQRYATEIAPVMASKQSEAWTQDVQGRQAEIYQDKEIGGDNLKGTKSIVNRVCNTYLKPEEFKALSEHMARFGDNAPMLKLLVRIGKSISEDKLINSNSQGTGTKTEEDRLNELYPTMAKK